jgi:hypothetical protein
VTLLIEDSPRNLLTWILEAQQQGLARGAVISPFASPRVGKQHRRSTRAMADSLRIAGADLWFDAQTHALQMGGVGDFRYYSEHALWGGARGDLSTPALRREHVRLVYEVQDALGATHLGPTVLLHHGQSNTSQQALELARDAMDLDDQSWLTIAGTSPFWASAAALDAHIGALAQLQPRGWFLVVARPLAVLPVEVDREEVHGLCRTVRALSEYAPVHISHGDLAGLPAVAAGATSLGTGWDQRQRVCAFNNFAARDSSDGGGGWYERPTFPGLMGSLKTAEAQVLDRVDAAKALRLGPVPAPGPNNAFLHHLTSLDALVGLIAQHPMHRDRFDALREMYRDATTEWPAVATTTGSALAARDWIETFDNGLLDYGTGEGW